MPKHGRRHDHIKADAARMEKNWKKQSNGGQRHYFWRPTRKKTVVFCVLLFGIFSSTRSFNVGGVPQKRM